MHDAWRTIVRGIVDLAPANRAGLPAENAPGCIVVPFAFVGNEAGRQHPLGLHDTDPAAVLAGACRNVGAQLVALTDHRDMHG